MNILITESQLKSIVRESTPSVDANWLYNWYSKVPEQKIAQTFTYLKYPTNLTINDFLKGNYAPQKVVLNRQDILNLLKNKDLLQIIPSEKFDFINKFTFSNALAFYMGKETKDILGSLKINNSVYKKLDSNLQQLIDFAITYSGRVIIPDDLADRLKNTSYDVAGAIAHEKNHYLFDITNESPTNIINKICKYNQCKDEYMNKRTEIYSYLFSIRKALNMTPIDVIDSVELKERDAKTYTVIVSVKRGNQTHILSQTFNKSSPVIKIFKCCTGSFSDSLKSLHNMLAATENKDTSYQA